MASALAYVMLFTNPLLGAGGAVLMRKLRKLSNMTVSCYMNLSGAFFFMIIGLCMGSDLNTFHNFNKIDWLAMLAASIMFVFAFQLYFVSF